MPKRNIAEEDAAAVFKLRERLSEGKPRAIEPAFRLGEGEEQYWTLQGVGVYVWGAADVEYKRLDYGGNTLAGQAFTAPFKMIINKGLKERAKSKAAATWRLADTGTLHLTNQRLALDTQQGFTSWWLNGIVRSEPLEGKVVLTFEGSPKVMLDVTFVRWFLTALDYLVWGKVD